MTELQRVMFRTLLAEIDQFGYLRENLLFFENEGKYFVVHYQDEVPTIKIGGVALQPVCRIESGEYEDWLQAIEPPPPGASVK